MTGSLARWWTAVGVGIVVSLPFAWLLSYGAMLPFFIGLFFYVLFGLMIGAAIFRTAAPRRPYSSASVIAGTTAVVLFAWGFSIVQESRDFPKDMAHEAAGKVKDIGDLSPDAYRGEVKREVRRFLRDRFPPGGTYGYVRWMLAGGAISRGELAPVDWELRRSPAGYWFAFRLAASIGLLAFGIASQTWLLRK